MSKLQLEFPRGEVIAEKYEIAERLDEGPLGVCYRAKHLKSGRPVRLLMLQPDVAGKDDKERLLDAAKTAKKISHERLLKFGELGVHGGVAYATMEDFPGGTLRELLQQNKVQGVQLGLREAAAICTQILEALRAVHDAGHEIRALRPEYILVNARRAGPRGANLVADVRLLYAGLWDLVPIGALGEDEFNRGEAQYLAPELKSFNPLTGPRTDVYSAGVIFYELLVGTAPIGTFQLPRSRRPDLPAVVDDIAATALANAPEDRYPSVREFLGALRGLATVQEDEVAEKRPPVHPMMWVLGAAMVLATAIILWRSSGDPNQAAAAADNALRNDILAKYSDRNTADESAIRSHSPANMLYIPAGPFIAGRLNQEPSSTNEPSTEVRELPAYLIDVFEHPDLKDAPPTRGVTWQDAARACEKQGKRLCTDDEWEKACKGPANLIYGYDDKFDASRCGRGVDDIHPAGRMPECKSGWGVFDMAGNLREWTSTSIGGDRMLVKGGLPASPERGTRCAFATDLSANFTDETVSFRCCKDLDPAPPPTP